MQYTQQTIDLEFEREILTLDSAIYALLGQSDCLIQTFDISILYLDTVQSELVKRN